MKKILSFVLVAVALVFTACSNDETIETSGNGQNNKGMVLVATVPQQSSRAAIDVNDNSGTWKFTFTDNDKVVVGNNTISDYYTFTKSGETFSSTDAKVTSTDADWYAYYPATIIDLTNQEGTSASAAKLYALAGKTAEATTGSTPPLKISMYAKVAVLRIVKVDNYGPCDIYLKTANGEYVSGLKAKKNEAGYDVVTSDAKVSVFTKAKEGNAGIYYVIVPAGVKISVWNNDRCFKTTKDAGLTAGKYYTLTSGPTTGTATIKGETDPINWVQLWIGGPRIATENVKEEMSWIDASKTGDNYVWGKNWCTPSQDDLDIVGDNGATPKHIKVELSTDNGVKHFKYKGIQPGYTSPNNEMTIPFTKGQNEAGVYWTSSTDGELNGSGQLTGTSFTITDWYGQGIINYFSNHSERHILYSVRPVLTIKTVLWGEENIK